MPKMTDHMESGEIVEWLAQEGDWVEAGQAILEVMTDKAVAELESPASGVLKGVRPGAVEGAALPVGTTLAFIAHPGEQVPVLPALGRSGGLEVEPARGRARSEHSPTAGAAPYGADQAGAIRATPVARRLARDLGIELAQVVGSGPGGRIREADVRAAAEDPGAGQSDEWLDLTPVQRRTGARMLESLRLAPQFCLGIDVDATELQLLRRHPPEPSTGGAAGPPSITALLVGAVACVLRDHPRVNSSFQDGRVRLSSEINIGVAVGGDRGLVVPVVHGADAKSVAEIDSEVRGFQERAQALRFSADEITGGTFTISNLGMYGVDRFSAILNPPQSAILAVGRIVKRPVGLAADAVSVRAIMSLTLTVDHRVLDGLQAARFLSDLRATIEQPAGLFGERST
jgi:pyruvate dehydrogenase E2 component (dihydrolipoamide acetyltransferase)